MAVDNDTRDEVTVTRTTEDPEASRVIPFEFRARRWSYGVELLVWVAVFTASIMLLADGLPGTDSVLFGSVLPRLLGAAGAVSSLVLGVNVARLLRDDGPALQITEEGVLNRTYSSSAGLAPWEEILEIRRTRKPGVLEIVLRDPAAFLGRQTWTTRLFMRAASVFGPGRFLVFLPQLEGGGTEVLDSLVAALDTVELAAVRDQRLLDDPSRGS